MLLSLSFGNLSHTSIRYDLAFYVNYHHYYFPFYFICGGQEISILLDSAEFIPLSENGEENQVSIFVNYTVNDPALVSQRINSVMKVYSTNGTLIKTSSFTEGFTINQTGSERHATLIINSTLQDVIAVVQFTNLTKTVPLSNPLQTNLNLSEAQVTPETETEIAALQPSFSILYLIILYQEIRKIDKRVRVCFITASEEYYTEHFPELKKEEECFMQKPISMDSFIGRVKLALAN